MPSSALSSNTMVTGGLDDDYKEVMLTPTAATSNTLVTGGFDDDYKEVVLTPTADSAKPDISMSMTKSKSDGNDAGEQHVEGSMATLTHDHTTEEEIAGVQEMLQALARDEVDAFADEHMPLRHLRAEKGNIQRAIEKIKSTIQWRKEFGVQEIVQAFEEQNSNGDMAKIISKENETGKIYARGHDKDGRALMYMRPSKENTNDEVNNMRHLVFQIEKAIACSGKNGRSKICLLIDYEGFKLRHSPPLSTSRHTLDILQKHYPERMYRAYVCNPPFVFRAFWAIIKPFVDPVTKEKMCFCSGKKGMETIVSDMGGPEKAKHLEKCAGGTDPIRDFDSTFYLSQPMDATFDETK